MKQTGGGSGVGRHRELEVDLVVAALQRVGDEPSVALRSPSRS